MLLLRQGHRGFVARRGALYLAGEEGGLSELAQDGDTVRDGQLRQLQQPLVDGYCVLVGAVGCQGRAEVEEQFCGHSLTCEAPPALASPDRVAATACSAASAG